MLTPPWQCKLSPHKECANQPVRTASLPSQVVMPLFQYDGSCATPAVNVGDYVYTGQCLTVPDVNKVPIHASISGTIVDIAPYPIAHLSGLSSPCMVIASDGLDQWTRKMPLANYPHVLPGEIINHIHHAGIIGLGGAGFSSAIKLNQQAIHTLVLNGVECEPYICADDALMQQMPHALLQGALIMAHALASADLQIIIAIGADKPHAYQALTTSLQEALKQKIKIVTVPSDYPAGDERRLVTQLTEIIVPPEQHPTQMGVLCHNVATAVAIYNAVILGEPLISRMLTITGDNINRAGNILARIGTPIVQLLTECAWDENAQTMCIHGGNMMGFPVQDLQAPINKTTHCLLMTTPPVTSDHQECIRCGWCANACPVNLLPQQLYWAARAQNSEEALRYQLFACIECGCCDYVCPSQIPLVDYFRHAKNTIRQQRTQQQQAALAQERYQQRQARLAAQQEVKKNAEDKQAAIQAALARKNKS